MSVLASVRTTSVAGSPDRTLRAANAASTPRTRTTACMVCLGTPGAWAETRAMYVRAGNDAGGVQRRVRWPAPSTAFFSRSVVSPTTDGCSDATPWPVARISSETTARWASWKSKRAVVRRAIVLRVAKPGPSPAYGTPSFATLRPLRRPRDAACARPRVASQSTPRPPSPNRRPRDPRQGLLTGCMSCPRPRDVRRTLHAPESLWWSRSRTGAAEIRTDEAA